MLLLDGIPKFYHRYGFCDVYDLSVQELDRQAVLSLPENAYTVRLATLNDAVGLLTLYERHAGPCAGSFERSIEQQHHWMQHIELAKLLVAIDSVGQVRGSLYLAATQAQGNIFLAGTELWELVVDDWSAALALLQYHIRLVERQGEPMVPLYLVPPASPVLYWMMDNLEVTDISSWDTPVLGWSVRQQTFHHRNSGWMARLVNISVLMQAMLPEWQARWQRSLARWLGNISIAVGNEVFTLRLEGRSLQLLNAPVPSAKVLSLTSQAFIQVIFGYRSISEIMQKCEQPVSGDVAIILSILFPTGQTWIPASDWF